MEELLTHDLSEHLGRVDDTNKIKIDDNLQRTENITCAICYSDITPDEPVYFCDKCNHKNSPYHVGCIAEWVNSKESILGNNEKPKCPTCKQDMPRYSPWVVLPKKMISAAYMRKYGNLGWLAKI